MKKAWSASTAIVAAILGVACTGGSTEEPPGAGGRPGGSVVQPAPADPATPGRDAPPSGGPLPPETATPAAHEDPDQEEVVEITAPRRRRGKPAQRFAARPGT